MPMGCALCGHAPYAHGCPGQGAVDHDYAQPSRELMAVRLEAWRFGIPLPASEAFVDAEVIPLVPAQRRPEQPASAAPTPLPKRPPLSFPHSNTRPAPRLVEPRQDRAARLTLARDPRAHRRARVVARAHEHTSPRRTAVLQQSAHLPDASERRQLHRILQPRSAVALGRGHPPTSLPSFLLAPYRQEVAA
ncbi:hypothetical protein [Streptosporangium vulgare]|uniref:Uncharacterized protein n=1 Tax=Streptosporangium vulgare TaxID=46190 RepID=A0ABV5TN86_9ACTN